jgi:hypothetical protein
VGGEGAGVRRDDRREAIMKMRNSPQDLDFFSQKNNFCNFVRFVSLVQIYACITICKKKCRDRDDKFRYSQ